MRVAEIRETYSGWFSFARQTVVFYLGNVARGGNLPSWAAWWHMRKSIKYGFALLALAGIPLGLLIWAMNHPPIAVANGVTMQFLGYSNSPNLYGQLDVKPLLSSKLRSLFYQRRFAQFMVTNQTGSTIRWRGDWLELEGNIKNRLPNYYMRPNCYEPVKPGAAFTLSTCEPREVADGTRWRLVMNYSAYNWRERLLTFANPYRLPLVGPLVLAEAQRIWNPTNWATASSPWLGQ